jgi:hypothetical protein
VLGTESKVPGPAARTLVDSRGCSYLLALGGGWPLSAKPVSVASITPTEALLAAAPVLRGAQPNGCRVLEQHVLAAGGQLQIKFAKGGKRVSLIGSRAPSPVS